MLSKIMQKHPIRRKQPSRKMRDIKIPQ